MRQDDGGSGGDGTSHSALPLALIILPVLVFCIHAPALSGYFAADDFLWLTHRDWSEGWHAITGNWGLGTAYRPLVRLSFLADARVFGWNAALWHAENLALHAVNATLLAMLARQAGARLSTALLVACLFAAAPVDWENVDWISGRTGLACLTFMLGAALFCLRYVQAAGAVWPACLCQALALLCYEPAAVLPLGLLMGAPLAGGPARPRLLACVSAMGAVAACLWLLRWRLLGVPGVATDVAGGGLGGLAFSLASLGAHVWRDLGVAGFACVGVILAAGLWSRASRLAVLCLLACALVLYLPFLPVRGFTERFAYLATAPLALALVSAAVPRRFGAAALCVLAVLFAWRSHAAAEGFRRAGNVTRSMLAQVAQLPDDGANLVFDGVPTHDGPYYLLWANFEDAAAAVRHGPAFAATAEWVLRTPALLQRARSQPTHFLLYQGPQGTFAAEPAPAWLHAQRP